MNFSDIPVNHDYTTINKGNEIMSDNTLTNDEKVNKIAQMLLSEELGSEESFNEKDFNKTYDYIKKRFPDAKFSISCFDTIDEVDNKILCSDEAILYYDYYDINQYNKKTKKWKKIKEYKDYFLIKKKSDKEYIYYCDVIDELIKCDFERNINCDHRYLENIRLSNCEKRNNNALNVYCSFWGS